ncbi:helix-turn-helix transcriptional regulator [Streptosporangium roseum]|uniref:DeoR family transcriptional regulator n=1 Tax=Streptosporangium roseum (strain ATCC 12428 / DSM 43021 / JCM 3005 / KCTC 9067 / NCIMB 10171 / NRRL 2505 / NI 9100) TaxID=479432 RepID=D2AX04_STRRD|nr:YafY family protein [Streptosporangium roseum]ACZ88932.1 DeoR family transcriptional regulator [Streptosporangium roseum DSM 43021]
MADTTARVLRLLSLLQAHREWPGPELAGRLEVSPRTLRRDIDRLRELGYPVHATTGPAGGYRLEAGTAMPPLLLDDEEAVAIAVGLRTAASGGVTGIEETSLRALAKLEQVLPSRLRRRVNTLQTQTVAVRGWWPTVDPDTLALLAQASRDHERLRFGYRRRDGTESARLVEPYRLASTGRRWYLVGWDTDRRDWRTFRVDRLTSPLATGARFSPREPPPGYVEESVVAPISRYRAVVTLYAPLEVVADRFSAPGAMIEALDEHSCLLRTGGDSLEWLALTIGMLGLDFTVHDPPELADYVGLLAARLQASTAPPLRQ